MNTNGGNRGVSVIIPAYNEEAGVKNVILGINDSLTSLNVSHEVVVVNDGSTDNTRALLDEPEMGIRLINHDHNLGYGAALKTGIRNAIYDIIVIIDADGTYPNECILELVEIFEKGNYDMIVGERAGSDVKIQLIRRPAKWFITKLASYLTGRKIPDLNSGLRVMKKTVVEKYGRLLPDGFSFTSTITLAMLTNGYSIKYVPIDYFTRKGKSKIRPIQDTLIFIQLVIKTVMYFNPLKVFVPFSLFLALLAFLILLGSWVLTGKLMDVTFGVFMMSAVMVMAIGMLADLIDKRTGG